MQDRIFLCDPRLSLNPGWSFCLNFSSARLTNTTPGFLTFFFFKSDDFLNFRADFNKQEMIQMIKVNIQNIKTLNQIKIRWSKIRKMKTLPEISDTPKKLVTHGHNPLTVEKAAETSYYNTHFSLCIYTPRRLCLPQQAVYTAPPPWKVRVPRPRLPKAVHMWMSLSPHHLSLYTDDGMLWNFTHLKIKPSGMGFL